MQENISRDLFIWDDELDEIDKKSRIKAVDKDTIVGCNNGEDMIGYMREFREGVWKGVCQIFMLKKDGKTKKIMQHKMNKSSWLTIALFFSWIMFAIVFKMLQQFGIKEWISVWFNLKM